MVSEKKRKSFILIIHNVRSAHNVGALFRTADGAGIQQIILTGYTPAPPKKDSCYLTTAEKAFKKTALGAEEHISWKKSVSLRNILAALKKEKFEIVALEQNKTSVDYRSYAPRQDVALVVGNEVRGVDAKVLTQCDVIIEIPMRGTKNSLNVSVAAGIALYHIASTIERGNQ